MARMPSHDTQALVAASARVFGELGYHNATIDDIATAAGMSRPTVYKYARSKRHLLDMMVAQVSARLELRLTQIVAGTGSETAVEQLHHLLRAHVENACVNRVYYRAVLREQLELSPDALAEFRAWERRITADVADLLDAAGENGSFRRDRAENKVLAKLIVSMTLSVHSWYDQGGPVSQERLVQLVIVLVSGVVPELAEPLAQVTDRESMASGSH